MQVVRLTVSRQEFTEITVTVPDDFDPELLRKCCYANPLVKDAANKLDAEFDSDFDADVYVEQLKVFTGEEAEVELGYSHVAITAEAIAAVEKGEGG